MSSLIAECYRRLTDTTSSEKPLRGYKVTDVNRTRKIGVACRSLHELKRKACAKLNVKDDLARIGIFLLDGSEIDEDYFATLEPQTTLILRRPGEKLLTEADVLYQMLRKVNESFLKSGERAAGFLTDKLKIKIAVLNRALNNDDKKTLCSRREDHPEWFAGLETNSPTKEAYLHRRCQDRIRGYLYKTIEQVRSSEVYDADPQARRQLERVIVFFKLQLRKDHYFGHYFDRTRSVIKSKPEEGVSSSQSDDETDSAQNCPYEHCPCKLSISSYERYILGLSVDCTDEDDDEVDAKKFVRSATERKAEEVEDELSDDPKKSKEPLREEAGEKCPYELVERSKGEMTALCDETGEFRCSGVWKNDKCLYADRHKINPYRSREELVLFSTWNLDHKIERSRTLVPQLLKVSKKGDMNEKDVLEFYNNLFTVQNLRLVHIVCHDKGAHK
ncbi:DNA fragmentation factor subunit beta [Nasonia vitripennis]|uniref:CIDE-N domain-containing protein n=1 Tax=Nasonia vitripennis TaxID=7425 RepID=A0A7M7G264_NASVI|nr:DNA fragmentation factor subunit beta [Nasonia vitripennis]